MPKKTTQKKLTPPAESEGSTEEGSSESEETPDTPSADETDEGTTTKTTETASDEESEEEETDEKPDEPPKKKEEKDKDKKPRKPVDPVVLDYAEHLKAQLGKEYDKELDSLPLRARISAMKVLVKLKNKPPNLAEGKVPKGKPIEKPVRVGGYNFKELGQKY